LFGAANVSGPEVSHGKVILSLRTGSLCDALLQALDCRIVEALLVERPAERVIYNRTGRVALFSLLGKLEGLVSGRRAAGKIMKSILSGVLTGALSRGGESVGVSTADRIH
jgi:hypothetical protein